MNLLFVLGSFYPAQTGGADNSVYWAVRTLGSRGHHIAVATTDSGLKPGDVTLNEWTPTEYGAVFYARTLIHYLPFRLFWTALRQVRHSDVVHLNALFYPSSLVTAFYCWLLKKPVVWSTHGELAPHALSLSPLRKRIFLALIRPISRSFVFHGTSELERQYIHRTFGASQRAVAIPLYAELPPQYPHDAGSGNPYLLFVGRINQIKNLESMLQALAAVPQFMAGPWLFKIIGIGEPDYVQSLRTLIGQLGLSDKVEFLGYKVGENKFRIQAQAYASVLPSHTENFSVVVVESLAQGTPMIASTHTPWQVLATCKAGWWVGKDADSLAHALTELLSLPDQTYQQYRQNARRLAEDDYDIDRHIDVWINLYESLLTRHTVPA